MKKRDSTSDIESSSESGVRPSSFISHHSKRRFGQNFLVDRNIVSRIIEAVDPNRDETIVEIGPGRGALTTRLAERAGRVVAVEFDRDLVPYLRSLIDRSRAG